MQQKQSFRARIADAIRGGRQKTFIPWLGASDGPSGSRGRINNYTTMSEQLKANVGWVFAANDAISEPASAVKLRLHMRKKDGTLEEIVEHELLELLDTPNFMHDGEQLRELHFTYVSLTGESYQLMMQGENPFIPVKGRLPDSIHIQPTHNCHFELSPSGFTKSTVRIGQDTYPLASFVRTIKANPASPLNGLSIVAAAAAAIDTDNQMKDWNRNVFANGARPSLVFKTNEQLEDDAYERWKAQFGDEHTGTANAGRPLLIEGGDVTTLQLSQQDLDFLNSRKFSKDEICAMFRISPASLGMTEGVNHNNMDIADLILMKRVRDRLRKYCNQMNSTLVRVYDPRFVLSFDDPVPENRDAKLKEAKEGTNKWMTIDETRALYGMDELPNKLGQQLYLPGTLTTIEAVADPAVPPAAPVAPPKDDEDDDEDDKEKSLSGVKKKT